MPSHPSLTSMKLPKRSKHNSDHAVVESDEPRFPFGLQLDFGNDEIEKLGMDDLPEAGEQMIVVGVGTVTNVRQTENKKGKDRSFTIQLEEIEVGPVETSEVTNVIDAVSAGIKEADGD